jgi:hypothetical protein
LATPSYIYKQIPFLMTRYHLTAVIVIFFTLHSHAQDSIPLLKGRVNISVTKGTIECDLTLSNIPKIPDYYIRLNSGMNIRYIRNPYGTGPLRYDKSNQDSLSTGESTAYYLTAYNATGKYLPRALQFSYVGMYPVIADTTSVEDWKGNIAFNGSTIRADGSQSAWYPILYDIKKDLKYDKLRYDIEVGCADCKTIYVNGSAPVEGTNARFKSDIPRELTMFSGNYRMVVMNGNYFLNPDMDDNQIKQFEETVQSYKNYYESHLMIPYKGAPVYIQTTPVSKYNAWLFATYPTIVNIGFGEYGMKTFFDKTKGDSFKPFMAHELGHYYFGAVRSFNSELGDMMSEGFAEYLSLSVTKKLISDSVYKTKLESKLRSLRNFQPVPFASVKSVSDYHDRELYVYYYAPLIFTAIEKEIGEKTMWEWLRSVLQTPAAHTNYQFMEQTLGDVLKDKEKFNMIRSKYFTTDSVVKNVATALGIGSALQNRTTSSPEIAKTYWYFFFSKPMLDPGAPENRTIMHTEVQEITCTQAELSRMAEPIFKRIKDECQNEGGCTSDFNTYETSEKARAALERWLKPFVGNPAYSIRTVVMGH